MSDDWPAAGTLLATRYRLVTLLETGGMAQIWSAQDELLARQVAIKLPTGPQVVWREARLAARLQHPGIAAVHDYREAVRTDGTVAPFVVMELLTGESVAARLVRETFTWPEAARIGAAVADALASAHTSGVVHRDIKPGNVMLTPTGVKILDFGISAAAGEPDDDDTGATFGTPAYVAPERLDGMPAVPATDVYGLGVLLFEMVTGQPPYPVETWEELEEARAEGPSTLPETLPAGFRAVVDRCLDERPDLRPTADEIRFDLTALWLTDQPDQTPSPGTPQSAPRTTGARSAGRAAEPAPDAVSSDDSPHPTTESRRSGNPPGDDGSRGDGRFNDNTPARAGGGRFNGSVPPRAGEARFNESGAGRSGDGDPRASRPTSPAGSRATTRMDSPVSPAPRRAAAGLDAPASGRSLQVAGQSYAAGRATAPGRAAAPTLPRPVPAPSRHRQVLALAAVLALLVIAGTAYAVANSPRDTVDAQPLTPPSHPAATLFSSRVPHSSAPATSLPIPATTTPSRSPSPSATTPSTPKPTVTLTFADAVSRLRTAVESGESGGDIRGDVATDLLNLIQPLENPDAANVNAQVDTIRRKINDRAGEGSISATQAAVLRTRVADLARVAGT